VNEDGDDRGTGTPSEPGRAPDAGADALAGAAPLSTGCGPLDDLLGGGVERGAVTQLYGPPASGKTNVALSTAVRTAADGGVTVYVDTEGLSTARFRQLAEGAAGDGTDLSDLTSRIVVSEVFDFEDQEEAVRDVSEFASQADLVVLDSATGLYRLERRDGDGGEALRRLTRQVTHLLSEARRHDLAVVVTNQVFSDPDGDRTRALGGHTFDHWCGVVVRLDRFRGGNRRATLEKHRSRPAGGTATFRIVEDGLTVADD
jgi:DNA repair protein RadB